MTGICRKIHRIWVQGEKHFLETEPLFHSYTALYSKYFPDFESKLWSEEHYLNLLERYNPNLVEIYNQAPSYACKADIARLVILFYEGGLYLDTDIEPFKRFAYLIEDSCELNLVIVAMDLCKSKLKLSGTKYNNAFIYALPGCLYIKELLDRILSSPFSQHKGSTFTYTWYTTGPGALTQLVEDLQLYDRDDVRVLSHSVVEVADFSKTSIANMSREEILKNYPFAVAIHRMKASWIKGISVYRKLGVVYSFYNNWSDYLIILALVLIFTAIIVIIYMLLYFRVPISPQKLNIT